MPSTGSRSWRCAERQHRAAVGERLVHGQVEAVVALLHLRAVERAGAALEPDPAAGRALPRLVVGALLEEQQVDAAVGGGLERRAPAGGRAGVAAGLLLPALDGLGLLLAAPRLEQRLDQLEQLGRRRVRLGGRPADDRLARLVREHVLELRARLLGGDDDQARAAQPAQVPVDVLGDLLQVVVDELLDVPLVARLRPAALVVAAGRVVGLLDDLLEPAGAQAEEVAALAADEHHQRALAAADQRDERREVEAAADLDRVRHARAQRQRRPEVVERRAEDAPAPACRRGRTPARSSRAGAGRPCAAPPSARARAPAAAPPPSARPRRSARSPRVGGAAVGVSLGSRSR